MSISVQDPRTLVEMLIALGPSHDGAVEHDLRIAVQRQHDEIERLTAIANDAGGWPEMAGRLKRENEILELQNRRLQAALAAVLKADA